MVVGLDFIPLFLSLIHTQFDDILTQMIMIFKEQKRGSCFKMEGSLHITSASLFSPPTVYQSNFVEHQNFFILNKKQAHRGQRTSLL